MADHPAQSELMQLREVFRLGPKLSKIDHPQAKILRDFQLSSYYVRMDFMNEGAVVAHIEFSSPLGKKELDLTAFLIQEAERHINEGVLGNKQTLKWDQVRFIGRNTAVTFEDYRDMSSKNRLCTIIRDRPSATVVDAVNIIGELVKSSKDSDFILNENECYGPKIQAALDMGTAMYIRHMVRFRTERSSVNPHAKKQNKTWLTNLLGFR